jgi:hypothetical protein
MREKTNVQNELLKLHQMKSFGGSEIQIGWTKYVTNPMELSPSWEATSRSATEEFPKTFYKTRRFITML